MNRLLALVLLLFAVTITRADILPKGAKWISQEIQIDNLKDHAGYAFFAYPRHSDFARAPVELPVGKSVSIGGNPLATRAMKLYAVPKDVYQKTEGKPKPEWFDGKTPTVLKSSERVPVQRTTRSSDPTTRIVTHYEVAIKDGKLTFKKVADKHYNSKNEKVTTTEGGESLLPDALVGETSPRQRLWFYMGIPAAAAGLAGLVLYRQRKMHA
jgi:hypothetical protein